jgi:acyl transferase domain-containing protein/NADPH:quinone reductase-like Zn-dependent oxidoreductase/acyl carrier protein
LDLRMKPDAIAIIGMAGRFPGADGIAQFWRNLRSGTESVTFFSRDELARRGVPAALLDDPLYVPAGAVLDGVDRFDADFFGFTPREAEITDPQHRIFLECAWEALEDGGYDPTDYAGLIGVYAGAGQSSYLLNYLLRRPDLIRATGALPLQLGNNKDYVPLRASYKLHLRGPSMNVNTACSSSLVAVHMACQGLIDHQCDIALAGGVGIQLPQELGYLYSPNGIHSPDGHCRAFDARAQGTISGNGIGIVVLKRLNEAIADRDSIRAVILGSAVNNDGGNKVGFTAPSIEGQAQVIEEALAIAQVEPATIGLIEGHGTGTPLGDPIEVAALNRVFRWSTSQSHFCALGSVKTNVGHLDEGAGVAGLIKAVLALQQGEIPPSLHFERPNPEIDFEHSPFYVPTRLAAWESTGAPRRAGVSSFGIGGTNAHVVLEEAPPVEAPAASRPWQMLMLSARTPAALEAMTDRLAAHIRGSPGIALADIAHTLHVGRKDFAHRRMVLCRDCDDPAATLKSRRPDRCRSAQAASSMRPITFLFPGQGSQHPGMGLGLYRSEPVFRDIVDRCAEELTPILGVDLRAVMFAQARQGAPAADELDQTALAQPGLFTIEYALAQLLISWGIKPSAMSGHSIGEYVAACLSGVFSLDDALPLVANRGRLMQQMPAGGMLVVELGEHEVLPFLRERLTLAVVNAPSLCVVAGALPAVRELEGELATRGIACRRLQTSHAFHSEFMEPMLDEFREYASEVRLCAPTIPYVSNLTGTWITADEARSPEYWARQLRHTVRFSQGLQLFLQKEGSVFVEVGPGQTLSTLVKRHAQCSAEHLVVSTMRHPHDPRDDEACLIEAVGRLWLSGASAKPAGFYAHEKRRRVPLPTYPFERQRFWADVPLESATDNGGVAAGEDRPLADWFYVPEWKRRIDAPAPSGRNALGDWLVLVDSTGLGERVVARMRRQGRRVVTVASGRSFACRGESSYVLDPSQPEQYGQLLAVLGPLPRNIVHLWSVTQDRFNPSESWNEAQSLGIYSLIFLMQAATRQGLPEGLSLHVVSTHMQRVVGTELSCPEKATLLGLVRVAPKEFPGTRCRSIDLVAPPSGTWDDGIVDRLTAELVAQDFAALTAIRGGAVWEESFVPRRIPAPRAMPARLRAGGTYLITGGLGSMGRVVARWLAREARARLVLLGRTALPPESEWGRRLNGGEPAGGAGGEGSAVASIVDFDPAREADLVERLRSAAEAGSVFTDIDSDQRLQSLLAAYCSGLIARYLRDCGVVLEKGHVHPIDAVRAQLQVQPIFTKFLALMLRALAQDGIVAIRADTIEVRTDCKVEALVEIGQTIVSEYPGFRGLVRLLDLCSAQYRPALSGAIPSISVLYPDGTSALLDECGRDRPEYTRDRSTLKTVAALLDHIAATPADRMLRILEVGGGTGGLTGIVLQALKGREVEYHFTDLGRSVVRQAELEAAKSGIDFMRFGTLDISRDPQAQGYARQSFDIVLGYNVVHATPRIEETVGRLRELLAPGGLLMLVETTRLRRWDEMVWGLTEGWWRFDDGVLRTESPLISLDQWDALMRLQGFDAVATFPRDQQARRDADVGLIVARQSLSPSPLQPATAHTQVRAAISAVREIRALGGDVMVVRADVADEGEMRAALAQAWERFGPPDGIIHAAGVLGQGLISGKTVSAVKRVLEPKAVGILVLDKLLRERNAEPDFILLCSSLASVAPIVGQVDYCAANAFLDAYAGHRAPRGRTAVLSVDWGFWQELGMIERSEMSQAGKQRITDEIREKGRSSAGIEVFRRILESVPAPQVLVSPDPLENFLSARVASPAMPEAPTAATPPHSHLRPVNHPWLALCTIEDVELETYVAHLDAHHWVLDEHRPLGKAVLPGTAYLELARAALATHDPQKPVQLTDVYFLAPLIFEDGERKELRTILKRRNAAFEFVVVSRLGDDEWQEHARGEISFLDIEPPTAQDLDVLERRCSAADIGLALDATGMDVAAFAERVRNFSPHWRNFKRVRLGSGEALATLELAAEFAGELTELPLHPALTDMATGYMSMLDRFESGAPFHYKRVRLWRPLRPKVHSHARAAENRHPGERSYDATVLDEHGNVLLDVIGFTLRAFDEAASAKPRAAPELASDETFCVGIERPGSLGTLRLRPAARRRPASGEVEIAVDVAGLNFIEVLYALGMLPEPPGGNVRFGLECAGRVAALGEGVDSFRLGEEVYGFASRAFSGFATTTAAAVARKPAHLTPAQAATIPAAFTTAYYSLLTRGRLRSGERVLIHAASGGVGLAAVNIARWRGAEIFATAGTPEKRDYLRSLGIRHVWDSRSLDFAAQALEATGGKGMDVVLNSLGGQFVAAGLSVLGRYGRFLELGKRDILGDSTLGLAPFEKHLSFMAIDVGTDLPEFDQVWRQVVRGIERRAFAPLPHREFAINRLTEAFEYMAQARHIGKIVVAVAGADPATPVRPHSRGRPLVDIIGRGATATRKPMASAPKPQAGVLPSARFNATYARPALQTPYRAPSGETEQRVATIWQELLGVSEIGVDDNFLELRGDSLLAAQVTSRLYAAFKVKLPLSTVFEYPTVAGLASRIEQMRQSLRELATAPSSLPGAGEVEQEL